MKFMVGKQWLTSSMEVAGTQTTKAKHVCLHRTWEVIMPLSNPKLTVNGTPHPALLPKIQAEKRKLQRLQCHP